jgi:hypothetical protein
MLFDFSSCWKSLTTENFVQGVTVCRRHGPDEPIKKRCVQTWPYNCV